uniref:Uncharacterized protein n=1 Tax=Meloidogyne enterolobii TaxID=390850 RepID=A0A6V7TSN8_MELEN|nr:unnamed protein product [Meloidogyne enterolobii]
MFFRRSVLSLKVFRCKSQGKCQTKKGEKCRSCRFDTCVKENMDISLIQFPAGYNFQKMKEWLSRKRKELMANNIARNLKGHQNNLTDVRNSIIYNANDNIIKTNVPQNVNVFDVDLEMLLSTENKALKLRQSPNNLLLEYLFTKSLENLIESKTNVLDFIELFGMNGKQLIIDENLFKEGKNLPTIGNYQNLDFLLEIEIMRKLPIFDKIPFEDKICLFRSNIHRLVTLSNCFQSLQMGESSVTYPNGLHLGDFCKNLFEKIFIGEDLKRYQVLRRRAFIDIITEFKPYNITQQEYVLLKTILFCNSIPENISQNSKNLLKLEAERYGQILMKYLQNLLGNFKGAMRHADCLLSIGKIFDYNRQQNIFYKMVYEKIFDNNTGNSLSIQKGSLFSQQSFRYT